MSRRRPAVDLDAVYVETAPARRMARVLDRAAERHTSHVVAALSGAGKSTMLDEYLAARSVERRRDGTTSAPVIAGALANDAGRSAKGLCESLLRAYGTVPAGSEARQTERLVTQIVVCGTKLVVLDDMHGARPDDLMLVKRLVDAVRARSGRIVPFVLLCAGTAARMPLAELINRPTLEWTQFRRRLSPTEPWIYVASMSAAEVRAVLAGYEAVLAEVLPRLRLARWSERVSRHLSHPFFLTDDGDRVTMQNVRNLVGVVVELLLARRLDDIPPDGALIDEAARRLLEAPRTKTVRRDPGAIMRPESDRERPEEAHEEEGEGEEEAEHQGARRQHAAAEDDVHHPDDAAADDRDGDAVDDAGDQPEAHPDGRAAGQHEDEHEDQQEGRQRVRAASRRRMASTTSSTSSTSRSTSASATATTSTSRRRTTRSSSSTGTTTTTSSSTSTSSTSDDDGSRGGAGRGGSGKGDRDGDHRGAHDDEMAGAA